MQCNVILITYSGNQYFTLPELSHSARSSDNVTATRDSSWAHVSLHWHRVHRPLSQSHWPGLNKSFMCQFSSLLAIEIHKSSVCSLNFPNWFNWRHCFHICIHLCIFNSFWVFCYVSQILIRIKMFVSVLFKIIRYSIYVAGW